MQKLLELWEEVHFMLVLPMTLKMAKTIFVYHGIKEQLRNSYL